MTTKWLQMVEAGKKLFQEPSSFTDQMKFFEARQDWRLLAWGYERMVRGLEVEELEKLRRLTFEEPDMEALRKLPRGTFGREYMEFFKAQNVSATSYTDAWPAMRKVVEKSWVVRRSLKLHDMHHVLLGFSCAPAGEWGITAFTTRNNREPNHALTLLGLPIGAFIFGKPAEIIESVWYGWSLAGRVRKNLFQMPLEEMYELPLDEVRRRCEIPVESRYNRGRARSYDHAS